MIAECNSYWQNITCRECIPGLPFPGNPGHYQFPNSREQNCLVPGENGNRAADGIEPFSVVAACSRDASSTLDWWVTGGRCHESQLVEGWGEGLLQWCGWLILQQAAVSDWAVGTRLSHLQSCTLVSSSADPAQVSSVPATALFI